MRAYVEHWDKAFHDNVDLLFFDDVGTGESFAAGCIANALLEREVTVLMTNFPTILNRLGGMFNEDRRAFIDSLDTYDLLILDNLGVERNTEYALETVYIIVDGRYRCRKPMIVTTNLKLDEMKRPCDLAHARIYDRILERCAPEKWRHNYSNGTGNEHRKGIKSSRQIGDLILVIKKRFARRNIYTNNVTSILWRISRAYDKKEN